jgi:hypothetical protein
VINDMSNTEQTYPFDPRQNSVHDDRFQKMKRRLVIPGVGRPNSRRKESDLPVEAVPNISSIGGRLWFAENCCGRMSVP